MKAASTTAMNLLSGCDALARLIKSSSLKPGRMLGLRAKKVSNHFRLKLEQPIAAPQPDGTLRQPQVSSGAGQGLQVKPPS